MNEIINENLDENIEAKCNLSEASIMKKSARMVHSNVTILQALDKF